MGPPIFLHSTWRTGSTYVWSKFRAHNDTLCFFEPLNEHLATATPAFIDGFAPWPYANHPPLDAPYLEEFRPLLASEGGVPGFPADLSYGQFRLDPTADQPRLQFYFQSLARHARTRGRRPVFGCVRTGLRIDWCRATLGGIHLFIRRNPRQQFISCLNQAVNGNRYFLERGWVILGANRDDPAFAPLAQLIGVPPFDGPPNLRDEFYARQAWTADWLQLYMIAFFCHALTEQAVRDGRIDLVIDINAIDADPGAAADTARRIEDATGLPLSLADCRIERYARHLAWSAPFFAEVEAKVLALLPAVTAPPIDARQ